MPIIFKQTTKHPPSVGSFGQSRSSRNLVGQGSTFAHQHSSVRRTVSGGSSSNNVVPINERHGLTIPSLSQKKIHQRLKQTRHSIGRLKEQGSIIKKYVKQPKLILPLIKKAYRRWHLKHLIPLFFVTLYMFLGAVLFFWLEAGAENDRIIRKNDEYIRERSLFVKRMEEIIKDDAANNENKRRKFVEEAVDHLKKKIQLEKLGILLEPQWTFLTSMYYAGTIFTTIGYGDIACDTGIGRIMSVLYAIIGIPLMLITLNELGKFLYKSINEFVAELKRQCHALFGLKCFRQKNKEASKNQIEKFDNITDDQREIFWTSSPDRRESISKLTQKGVNFNLQEVEPELSLEMYASDDPQSTRSPSSPPYLLKNNNTTKSLPSESLPPYLHKTNSVTKSVTSEESKHIAIMIEDDGNSPSVEELEDDQEDEMELLPDSQPAPRMPVFVAVTFTASWIFFCAALFKMWESWSYGESLYFMFISLLTIGLGDINVTRKDLMMVCFIFVIIGLSLVSMCINVIQCSLEDLYKRMLMKILMDYHAKLARGESQKGATLGVIQALGANKAARFLVPMMSSETKRSVMQKVQNEARETGKEIPPIFENYNLVEKLITTKDKKDQKEETQIAIVEEILLEANSKSANIRSLPTQDTFDNHTQTELVLCDDKNDQTITAETDDLAIQVSISIEKNLADQLLQTDDIQVFNSGAQTDNIERKEVELMTTIIAISSQEIQTDTFLYIDESIQTFEMIGLEAKEVQTEPKETKNTRIQTPVPILADAETQCDDIEPQQHQGRFVKAKRNWNGILAKLNRSTSRQRQGNLDVEPSMSGWKECEGEESSASLDWDPVDGMHAERQKSVKDLKRRFDRAAKRTQAKEAKETAKAMLKKK